MNDKQAYIEREFNLNSSKSTGIIKEIRFESIHMMRISLMISEDTTIPFMASDDKVILFFGLRGDSNLNTEFIQDLNLKASSHNIIYTSPSTGRIDCKKGQYEVFYIGMSPKMFKKYLPSDELRCQRFFNEVNQSNFSLMRKANGVLNHKMLKVIEDITQFDSQESIKKIFLKAKVIELLSLQLEELKADCPHLAKVRPDNAKKMYEVKNFIISHLFENHTLGELAQRVGTNEYTLKKEFKQLFGKTVFGFWAEVKMEEAQKLLSETYMEIKEISEYVGYKNPQHFSTAFKRTYGITPSQFRKDRSDN